MLRRGRRQLPKHLWRPGGGLPPCRDDFRRQSGRRRGPVREHCYSRDCLPLCRHRHRGGPMLPLALPLTAVRVSWRGSTATRAAPCLHRASHPAAPRVLMHLCRRFCHGRRRRGARVLRALLRRGRATSSAHVLERLPVRRGPPVAPTRRGAVPGLVDPLPVPRPRRADHHRSGHLCPFLGLPVLVPT